VGTILIIYSLSGVFTRARPSKC